jgi:hypothetical protein
MYEAHVETSKGTRAMGWNNLIDRSLIAIDNRPTGRGIRADNREIFHRYTAFISNSQVNFHDDISLLVPVLFDDTNLLHRQIVRAFDFLDRLRHS